MIGGANKWLLVQRDSFLDQMKYLLCFEETIINCEGDFLGLFPAEWKRLIQEELKQFQNKKY